MKAKVLSYGGEAATVSYDLKRCIHAAECVHGLPQVFDPKRKPWVLPDEASPDELLQVVTACPTGALHVERKDGGGGEATPSKNTARIEADGPVYVLGDIEIAGAGDESILHDTRVAFCRCGASENKPLCDGAHAKAGFRDPGELPSSEGDSGEQTGGMRFTPIPNGPLLFAGPLELTSSAGEARTLSVKGALCRCGASQNNPYCDGAHAEAGFLAD